MLLKTKQFAHLLLQTVCMTGIVLIIVTVLSFSLVRFIFTPILSHPTVLLKLQQGISSLVGQPLRVKQIIVSWDGFNPLLKLSQLEILDNKNTQTLLKIGELDFGTDLLSDVLDGRIRLDELRIQEANFIVRELTDGGFSVNGMDTKRFAGNGSQFFGLSRHGQLILRNVVLNWFNKTDKIPLVANLNTAEIFWRIAHSGWSITTDWQNLTSLGWGGIPNLSNLNGSLHVAWQHTANNSLIKISDFTVKNTDISAEIDNMTLALPNDGSSPSIHLQAGFQLKGAKNLANYLPTALHPGLRTWLISSIVKLQNLKAKLFIQGPLNDFPFDNGNGKFILDSEIQGGELRFKPEWPALEDLACRMVINSRKLTIDIHSAQILKIPLENVHTEIPIVKKGVVAMLHVDANNISGDLNDGLDFIRQSPLHEGMLDTVSNFQAKGPMQLQLHLIIPLEKTPIKTDVDGQLLLQNNDLMIPKWHIELNNLNGQLSFTRDSMSAPALNAVLWDKPIKAVISTPKDIEIQLRYLDILAKLIPQTNGGWSLAVQSPTMLGQVLIPKNKQQTLQANFQRLYLKDDTLNSTQKWSPIDLPALNFSSQDFRYGNKQLGQVQVQLTPIQSGVRIDKLQATTASFNLNSNGVWRVERGGQATQLTGVVTSPAIGTALNSLGLPTGGISAQQTTIQFNLAWPAAAYDPSFKSMVGNINLNLKQGEINDVSLGTTAKIALGRLLNLLSIKSLLKDIRLDFSDLKAQGFTFDLLQGDFVLRNGDAVTQNAHVKSGVADVDMRGRIGLAAKDFDLVVAVTPHVTGSLPVIAGILGGPVLGPVAAAATWATDKLISPAVQTITKNTYRVTGPWSNPSIIKAGSSN